MPATTMTDRGTISADHDDQGIDHGQLSPMSSPPQKSTITVDASTTTTTTNIRSSTPDSGIIDEPPGGIADLNDPFVMANDYIWHALADVGIDWPQCPDLPDTSVARLVLRQVGREFCTTYAHDLSAMEASLQLDANTIYPAFRGVVDQIFHDQINWGRIVALFAFAGALAVRCMRDERPDLVRSLADFTAVYMRNSLQHWIDANGSWTAFVAWYEKSDNDENGAWPSWKWMAGVGAAGVVGAGMLTKLLTR